MSKTITRLSQQFQPETYTIKFARSTGDARFKGYLTITGRKTGRPSRRLTFHQRGLVVRHAEITRHDKKGNQPLLITRINNHKSYDEVRLHADGMVYPGQYTVRIEFSGKITPALQAVLATMGSTTVFDSALIGEKSARIVMPCIDEPAAIAAFNLVSIDLKS